MENLKMPLSGAVLLVILSLVSFSNSQNLILWEDFLRNVGKKLIASLEELEITGSGMPMKDFDGVINQTQYDIKAIGTAKFHSGFVAKIDESGILSTSYRSQLLDTYSYVYCFLTLDGVQIVYDVDYEYENFKGRGTVLTWFKQLQFQMDVRRNHTTNEVTSAISLYNTGSQNDYVVKVHPNNGYTQLTAREIKRSPTFREPMANSFRDWGEAWSDELRNAAAAFKFPEICYYCP